MLQQIQSAAKINGRSERIRTSDPLVPNEVRYQAALHSDLAAFPQSDARGRPRGLIAFQSAGRNIVCLLELEA